MTRHVLFLDLLADPESIARYEAWHEAGQVPAKVIASIRAAGISAMEIWRRDDRLVMIMQTGPDSDPVTKAERDACDPDIIAWEYLMDSMQRRLPGAAECEKWAAAKQIFDLDAETAPLRQLQGGQ